MNDQFPNYMDVKPKVPHQIWIMLRIISTLSLLTLIIILMISAHTGLFIFWGLCVPMLPLVFFVAPGLWRNVCPLASTSQLPRELGFTKSLPAAKWIKHYGYFFSSGPGTWHGMEKKEIVKERRCLQVNYVTFNTDWPVY